MDCPDGQGFFISGPVDNNKFMNLSDDNPWVPVTYVEPVDASEIEFALGMCNNEQTYKQAAMLPIFNQSLFNESKSKVIGKPRIIFFLTLDSFSRKHFFRKIPAVISLLNNLDIYYPDLAAYDFKLHNVKDKETIHNMGPIFAGHDKFTLTGGLTDPDAYGDKALWNILRKKGYISLLAVDDCDYSFPVSMGQFPKVDYKVRQFYCATEYFSRVSAETLYKAQRCIGPHQSHYYLLNYTMNIVRMYQGANMWLSLHLNAGHDGTGQHAATLNSDLREFLEDFLTEFQQQSEIAIILTGDHGMRFGTSYGQLDGYQEARLPGFFLIASKNLLEKYPYSHHSLLTNTQRLVSKLDIRETTLSLAGIQEKTPYSIDLLTEIAPKSRNCIDIGTQPLYCACSKMIKIESIDDQLNSLLIQLREYSESMFNSMTFTNSQYPLGSICKRIVLDKVFNIYHTEMNNVSEILKIEYGTSIHPEFKLEVNFHLFSDGSDSDLDELKYKSHNIVVKGFHSVAKVRYIQIISATRLDRYGGECEIKARKHKIDPQLCICT